MRREPPERWRRRSFVRIWRWLAILRFILGINDQQSWSRVEGSERAGKPSVIAGTGFKSALPRSGSAFRRFFDSLQHFFSVFIGGVQDQSLFVCLLSFFQVSGLHISFGEAVPDISRPWKRFGIQIEHLDGSCEIFLLQQGVAKGIQRALSKIIGRPAVELLFEISVVLDRGLQSLRSILFAELFVKRHGPGPAVVAGVAPHVYALVAARLDFFQMVIDIAEQAVHFPGAVLVGIFVGGKIEGAQRLAFFSLVAIRAAHT